MSAAEPQCVTLAQCRVIASAAFGDVMEKCRQIQSMFLEQSLHEPAAVRQLMVVLWKIHPSKVTQYEQQVGVHGVSMK